MKYKIVAEPVFVSGNLCTYGGITIDSIIVNGGTLIGSISNNFSIQWGGNNTGSILILFSTSGSSIGVNCSDSILLRFSLLNNPIAAFTYSPSTPCFNNPTSINFNSNSSIGGTTYFWNFGDGFTYLGTNPSHTYTNPGMYNVCLTLSNSIPPGPASIPSPGACLNCSDTYCERITIDPLPGPDIECVATVCNGDTAQYCTSAAACTNYNWTVVGGTIIGSAGGPCITVVWGSGNPQGTVDLNVLGCSSAYCGSSTTVNVPIIAAAGIINGDSIVCINSNEIYTLPTWPACTYSWSVNGPAIISGNNTNSSSVSINWNTFGTYTITATYLDTLLNCGGSASLIVNVKPQLLINGLKTLCAGASTNYNSLFAPPATPVPCNWSISPGGANINSGNGSNTINVSWPLAGTYTITASAVNPTNVCADATYEVEIIDAPIISNINGGDSICAGSIKNYAAQSNANGIFSWTVVGGTFSSLSPNNDSIQITWASTGPYGISVTQTSIPSNCVSNLFSKTIYVYPTPLLSGSTNVCADDTVLYIVSNISDANFNWSINPPNLATIISGQGNDSVYIKWHGSNSPGSSNTAYLYFGACGSDSVAISINEPAALNITASGSLCGGGVNLNTGATGTFNWTCTEHAITPAQSTTLATLTALNQPGHYNVTIQNYNGSGCTVNGTYNTLNTGLPVAQISASNVLQYCLSNLPNMTMSALTGAGYSYQWYKNNTPVGTASTLAVNSGAPCFVNAVGTYTFYCDVSYLGCTVSSNQLVVTVLNCTGSPGGGTGTNLGCGASISVTNVSSCNPFTVSISATAPAGANIVPGTQSITHLDDNSVLLGQTTKTYTSVGYKLFKICTDVTFLPGPVTCSVCKDTSALVDVIAKFLYNDSCGIVSITDQSNVFAPSTITAYGWYVGDYPNNIAVGPGVANISNASIANPTITFLQSDTFIINQLVVSSNGCPSMSLDTLVVQLPDANFASGSTCVNTLQTFISNTSYNTNYWDFGDASSSYTNPSSHAYTSPGTYNVMHVITDDFGCIDTAVKPFTVNPTTSCNITYSNPTTFCFHDSLPMTGCPGYSNYQWYNNGQLISSATSVNYTALQTGNYHFLASDANGCDVISDTVNVTVLPAPSTSFYEIGTKCEFATYEIGVPYCLNCNYFWMVDNVPQPIITYNFSGPVGVAPFTIGTHTISVTVVGANGCISMDSLVITFNSNPSVSTSVSGNPAQMCSNNLYTITASSSAANPAWQWLFNSLYISDSNAIVASAAGVYVITVTDGLTGCTASDSKTIDESPNLELFPLGCDSLCDSLSIYIPLASINGNTSGYIVKWYDNAPPFSPVIGSGTSLNLNSLALGNHMLSVIVTAANGCVDTSSVYDLDIYDCSLLAPLGLSNVKLNGEILGDRIQLSLKSSEEQKINLFELEKSADGHNYTSLNSFTPQNNLADNYYYYPDMQPFVGSNFYRVKVHSNDNSIHYSNTIELVWQNNAQIEVYPTMSASGLFNIKNSYGVKEAKVLTLSGELVKLVQSSTDLKQINLSEVANGGYIITLKSGKQYLHFKVSKL